MENRYKCPECNTPLNDSMFCVKCCSKWTKTTQKEQEESNNDFIACATGEGKDIFGHFDNMIKSNDNKKSSKQLADEHWGYIEALLKAHEEEYNIKQIEFHYKSAFIHGYKHAMEDK